MTTADKKYLSWYVGLCVLITIACARDSSDGDVVKKTTQNQKNEAKPSSQKPIIEKKREPTDLSVVWPTWSPDGYDNPEAHIQKIKNDGFKRVCLVPNYACRSLERIEHASAPSMASQKKALIALLKNGFSIIYRPQLDPMKYFGRYRQVQTDDHSWVPGSDWRGMLDIDPLMKAYKDLVILRGLSMIREVLDELGTGQNYPVIRFDIGSELMNSMVFRSERWVALLEAVRTSDAYRAIKDKVVLSHNFCHHFEIPEDFVRRMAPSNLKSLSQYLRGLDAMSVSQYMDLTLFAPPSTEKERPLPSREQVAKALRYHEDSLMNTVLLGHLKMRPDEIPTVHIGEFGIGTGGLRHPNLWEGDVDENHAIEATRGFEGLISYLDIPPEKRVAKSAVLWVAGGCYDIFGWQNPNNEIPATADSIRAYLASQHP
jgi:hypothetical protein